MPPEAIQKDETSIRPEIRNSQVQLESLERTYEFCSDNDYLRHWIPPSVEPAVSKLLKPTETKPLIAATSAEVHALASMNSIADRIYPGRPHDPLNATTSSSGVDKAK